MSRLYLGNAFGWETEFIAKVAISQKEAGAVKCLKAQLIKNESLRWIPNILKIFGYIPVINFVAGSLAIAKADDFKENDPNHTIKWRGRGVAMIFFGPLLFVVDLIALLANLYIAYNYNKNHANLIKAFDVDHEHTPAFWPGHPVHCKI